MLSILKNKFFPAAPLSRPLRSSSFVVYAESEEKRIRFYHPVEKRTITAVLSSQKTLDALLNTCGCGGGALKSANGDTYVFNLNALEADELYEPVPALSPSVSNITLLSPPSVLDGQERPGSSFFLNSLKQKGLDHLLLLSNAVGLISVGEQNPPLLQEIQELQAGGTYQMVAPDHPSFSQQDSEQRRLQGHEWSTGVALENIARKRHGKAAQYRHLLYKKYKDGRRVVVEIDGGGVVDGNNLGPGLDLYFADHKQTVSIDAVNDVIDRVTNKLSVGVPNCPELSKELEGVQRVHVFLMADTTCQENDEESWNTVIQYAASHGIHVVRRNGAEYVSGMADTASTTAPGQLKKCYTLEGKLIDLA